MTTIFLHGILVEDFPEMSRIELDRLTDVTNALDAIHDGFRIKLMNLAKIGINYGIVADGKDMKTIEDARTAIAPREIHFVPIIGGSAGIIAASAAAITAAAGAVTAAAGAIATGLSAITGLTISATSVMQFGVLVAGLGIQMLLAPKPKSEAPKSSVAGLSESSFIGSSAANLMEQGSPLPIGYGRLRVGSSVINMTTKSFQTSKKQNDAMLAANDGAKSANTQITTLQGKKNR